LEVGNHRLKDGRTVAGFPLQANRRDLL